MMLDDDDCPLLFDDDGEYDDDDNDDVDADADTDVDVAFQPCFDDDEVGKQRSNDAHDADDARL